MKNYESSRGSLELPVISRDREKGARTQYAFGVERMSEIPMGKMDAHRT